MILIAMVAPGLEILREISSTIPSYYIQGEVKTPGRVPIAGKVTVLDALNRSGGLLTTLSDTNVTLVRVGPFGSSAKQTLPIDIGAILLQGNPVTNYVLKPGDRVIVSRNSTNGQAVTPVSPSKLGSPRESSQ